MKTTKQYTANNTLTVDELNTLSLLLSEKPTKTKFNYANTILVLLKEFNWDIRKVYRLLITDKLSKTSAFVPSVHNRFVIISKEAVILTELEKRINSGEYLTIHRLTKLQRFRDWRIDRNIIRRTINKYGITYKR